MANHQNNKGNSNKAGNNGDGKYVGAPYNFVPFSDKILAYGENIPAHDASDKELYSGEIRYKITAKTPIIIDDGKGNFWKNAYGKEAIPGSSIRGLIRSNAQILSLSGISDDVDDYALMYRNVASGKEKKRYGDILGAGTITVNGGSGTQQVSVLKNVRAGYIRNENGTYKIYDTTLDKVSIGGDDRHEMNYYILSERKLAKEYDEAKKSGGKFAYPFFVKKDGSFITQHYLNKPFKKENSGNRIQYKGTKNDSYIPYAVPCSYTVSGRDITGVDGSGELENEGYAVSTGKMNMKKAIYIIPKIDEKKQTRFKGDNLQLPIEVSDADVQAFKTDINKRETTLKTFGGRDYFDLPEEGKMKPVFYIYIGKRLYFGFTPRLRIFYDHTIKEGMTKEQRSGKTDYVKAIFGYADAEKSRKSRVSFMDAVAEGETGPSGLEMAILSEPKPTSYLDYLTNEKTYNSDNFSLRGIKQYWLRDKTYSNVPKGKEREIYVSKFSPLPEETVFNGKVRFHNLREDELGLILWSMRLEGEKSRMNIGKAKAFGYGNIELNIKEVHILNQDTAYDLEKFTVDPYVKCEDYCSSFIEKYKEAIKQKLGRSIEDEETVKTLFLMKNSEMIPDKDSVRFMELDKKEYQSRTCPLPSVEEVLGLKNKTSNVSGGKASSGTNHPNNGRSGSEKSGIYGSGKGKQGNGGRQYDTVREEGNVGTNIGALINKSNNNDSKSPGKKGKKKSSKR